jgi:dienelactone hydrolase
MEVFLSYVDTDKEFVKDVASRLSREGYDVWNPDMLLERRTTPGG